MLKANIKHPLLIQKLMNISENHEVRQASYKKISANKICMSAVCDSC